jgi:hypothetical protein
MAALRRLDRLLASAVRVARQELGRDPANDPFRGLYVTDAEVDRLLQREPGAPRLWVGDAGAGADAPPPDSDPAVRLQRLFHLSDFELDAVIVALAVEIDLKYQRLFAWLQDDATRRRPTVSLLLDLLCRSTAARLDRLRAFADDAPLLAGGIVHLLADEGPSTPRIACAVRLDEAVARHLLGHEAADARLASFCTWHAPALALERIPVPAVAMGRLGALLRDARDVLPTRAKIALQLKGPAGAGQREIAEAVAHALGAALVVADLSRAPRDGAAEGALRLLGLEASLRNAVVFVHGLDGDGHASEWRALPTLLASPAHVVLAAGTRHPAGHEAMPGAVAIQLGEPDVLARRAWWADRLDAAGFSIDSIDVGALADRFRLSLDAIGEAVRAAGPERCGADATAVLMAHARAVSSHSLDSLAQAIEPVRTFDDLVLPAETLTQLRELCDRVVRRARVLDGWGFARKLSGGTGTNALFTGPPGTGKTLAAEVVAHALGLKLYRIDLATIVSKYIGETEKNLARVFQSAERSNAVLMFDEADALFGKRSAVRDAHDRYANIEISYLLQRMEQYEGVAILATNLAQNMDEAFVRRLAFTVSFPFPGEELRRPLWMKAWPGQTPISADLDPTWLARRFKLSGGSIKNVALAAAHLVGDDEAEVTLDHVLRAVRREFQKMGKALSDSELGRVPRAVPLEAAS